MRGQNLINQKNYFLHQLNLKVQQNTMSLASVSKQISTTMAEHGRKIHMTLLINH